VESDYNYIIHKTIASGHWFNRDTFLAAILTKYIISMSCKMLTSKV
jgi:hypothetical protein